jgi:hypothetical protein
MSAVTTRVRYIIGGHFLPSREAITQIPVEIPGALNTNGHWEPAENNPQSSSDSHGQARTQSKERNPKRIRRYPIDIINTNSTSENTLRYDNLVANKPTDDRINSAKTVIYRTVRQLYQTIRLNSDQQQWVGNELFAT